MTTPRHIEPFTDVDQLVRALVVIIQGIQSARRTNTAICPEDGCLIMAGRRCPACDVRNGVQLVPKGERPAPEPDFKRPVRWVKSGATRRPVYAHDRSEVA